MTGRPPAPLPLRVRLPFETEEAFIRRFGANVSPSGIFIPTRSLKPEGTHLRFELVLADGTRLLRGGVVVQDAIEAAPGRRGGMELAFTELDAQSHAVLARILASRPELSGAEGIGVPSWRRQPASPTDEVRDALPPTPRDGLLGLGGPDRPGEAAQNVEARARAVDAPAPDAQAGATNVAGASNASDTSLAERAPSAEGSPDVALATGSRGSSSIVAPASTEQAPPSAVARASDVPGGWSSTKQPTEAPDAFLDRIPDDWREEDGEREEAAREAAQLAQTRARAERVETLARASAREADALVSRIRGATPTTVLATSIDFPEAGIARWKGGGLSIRPSPVTADSACALRLLGQRADAPRVLELAATEGRRVHADPEGFAGWDEGGEPTEGVEWAARWMERQAHAGEALAGGTSPLWVLALPLHAGHRQREAWVTAAARLGFDRVQLTSSPIAAAAAYAHGKGFARRRLLILSTGAVGFDAAIVQLTGDDVETLSAAGDPFLGLPELEARLAYELRRRLREAGSPVPEPGDASGQALLASCAAVRRALEKDSSTSISLRLPDDAGSATRAGPFEVTREDLDGLSQDLVERQLALVSEVLGEAQLSASGVDGVLVLGSVERSPLWKQRLSELLGREISSADEVDPSSVIRGAALIGEVAVRTGRGRRPFNVFEVLSVPLAIAERTGRLRRVLERGTRLPLSKTLILPVRAGQELGVLLYQGSGATLADAEPLGALRVQASLPGDIEIQLRVGDDGRVQVTVETPGGPRLPLPKAPLDPEARDALLSIAPEGSDEESRGTGLLGGLRRLFRKA